MVRKNKNRIKMTNKYKINFTVKVRFKSIETYDFDTFFIKEKLN
ncbi:hypothetical protein CMALT394_420005 [Carnobacterium maltaromaticum]|nr:hypothetical protein CMALT394_420005 [Carnobacterium maltaromaticum]